MAIITKNEEANIGRCLRSLGFAHEIVVADSGSTDATVSLCRSFGCKVFDVPWMGFGKTKQFCVDQTACDWVLSIDADEEVSPELQQVLADMEPPESVGGFFIRRRTSYLGRWIRFSGWQNDAPLRLFNRHRGKFTPDIVHEQVTVTGRTSHLDDFIFHYSYPDLASHLKKLRHYSGLGAEKLAARGKSGGPVKALFHGSYKFFHMYCLKLGFLDRQEGLILAVISAFGVSMKYFMLWERTRARQAENAS